MPQKTPGGPLPKQTGTQQKTPSGDKSNPTPAKPAAPGGKGGGKK
jgi:hypothetical protein